MTDYQDIMRRNANRRRKADRSKDRTPPPGGCRADEERRPVTYPTCAWCGKPLTQSGMLKAGIKSATVRFERDVTDSRRVSVGWHVRKECSDTDPVYVLWKSVPYYEPASGRDTQIALGMIARRDDPSRIVDVSRKPDPTLFGDG